MIERGLRGTANRCLVNVATPPVGSEPPPLFCRCVWRGQAQQGRLHRHHARSAVYCKGGGGGHGRGQETLLSGQRQCKSEPGTSEQEALVHSLCTLRRAFRCPAISVARRWGYIVNSCDSQFFTVNLTFRLCVLEKRGWLASSLLVRELNGTNPTALTC